MDNFTNIELGQLQAALARDQYQKDYRKEYNKRPERVAYRKAYNQARYAEQSFARKLATSIEQMVRMA